MPRADSSRRQPLARARSVTGVPGGSVTTTGEASAGAKRSTSGFSPAPASAAGAAVSAAFMSTAVFCVLAARSDTKTSGFGFDRVAS